MALLEVRDVSHSFGGLQAVSEYNLSLEAGEITGLIGPNGAGKTTIFNLIAGMYKADKGEVVFDGRNILDHKSLFKIGFNVYPIGKPKLTHFSRSG